jgi:mRNA-degrading endonuclease RelE of RelBE toxin-antitoxin system
MWSSQSLFRRTPLSRPLGGTQGLFGRTYANPNSSGAIIVTIVSAEYDLRMVKVVLTAAAAAEFDSLPQPIRTRIAKLLERLGNWPAVSGVKPLRGKMAGCFRMRTGDYRLQFRFVDDTIQVSKVGHRDGFYEE